MVLWPGESWATEEQIARRIGYRSTSFAAWLWPYSAVVTGPREAAGVVWAAQAVEERPASQRRPTSLEEPGAGQETGSAGSAGIDGGLNRLLSEVSGRCGYRYRCLGRLCRGWHYGLLRELLLSRRLLLLCCRCCGRLESRLGGGGRRHRCGLRGSCLLLGLGSGCARRRRSHCPRPGLGLVGLLTEELAEGAGWDAGWGGELWTPGVGARRCCGCCCGCCAALAAVGVCTGVAGCEGTGEGGHLVACPAGGG